MLDQYLTLYNFFQTDGHYVGPIETFLTPLQHQFMLSVYYSRNEVDEADQRDTMDTDLFCKLVQDIVNRRRSKREVQLTEAELIQDAKKHFAKDKPWPEEDTTPDFFFFNLNTSSKDGFSGRCFG